MGILLSSLYQTLQSFLIAHKRKAIHHETIPSPFSASGSGRHANDLLRLERTKLVP